MDSRSLREVSLVGEMQLGGRLNQAVNTQNRADFALLLAMLSKDVTDAPHLDAEDASKSETLDLRSRLQLPPAPAVYAKTQDFSRGEAQSQALQSGGMGEIFLGECLRPSPLVPFERSLSPEVMAQLSPLAQEKVRRQYEGHATALPVLGERGDGFGVLDEIASSRAQISLSA